MRKFALIAILTLPAFPAANKLTWEDRVELTRGLTAEYATVKVLLPRAKKALEFEANGGYDKKQWNDIARESGPAARSGDMVQVTKIEILEDRIVLQINGGFKGGKKVVSGRPDRYGRIYYSHIRKWRRHQRSGRHLNRIAIPQAAGTDQGVGD